MGEQEASSSNHFSSCENANKRPAALSGLRTNTPKKQLKENIQTMMSNVPMPGPLQLGLGQVAFPPSPAMGGASIVSQRSWNVWRANRETPILLFLAIKTASLAQLWGVGKHNIHRTAGRATYVAAK
jgi:hypothetical protein